MANVFPPNDVVVVREEMEFIAIPKGDPIYRFGGLPGSSRASDVDRGTENAFLRLRRRETDGMPICPNCGCQVCDDCPRSAAQAGWNCKACDADFSVPSGTPLAEPTTVKLSSIGCCSSIPATRLSSATTRPRMCAITGRRKSDIP